MNWLWLAAAGAANFTFIGLKAFQQRNVIHGDFGLVIVTSNLLAFAEVFVVYTIASKGVVLPLILTLGMSGGLGCVFAMKLHDRLLQRRTDDD